MKIVLAIPLILIFLSHTGVVYARSDNGSVLPSTFMIKDLEAIQRKIDRVNNKGSSDESVGSGKPTIKSVEEERKRDKKKFSNRIKDMGDRTFGRKKSRSQRRKDRDRPPPPNSLKNIDGSVYRKITQEFESQYRDIVRKQAGSLESGGKRAKGLNHVGINFTKGFGTFSVEVKRDVSPDLFDDSRYLVIDNLYINVDATKLLGGLKDDGLIDISEEQFAAYAGIAFKRHYRYVHFSDTYLNALKANPYNLFFNYMYFKNKGEYLKLKPYEFITREDSISARAGTFASTPLSKGLSVGIGVVGKYEKLSRVDIQAIGQDDQAMEGEKIRISFEKSTVKTTGLSARLQADFIKLIKLSLFSFDYQYSFTDSYRINLSFRDSDIAQLRSRNRISREVDNVLKHGTGDLKTLMPFIVSQERRREENIKSKYAILIFGSAKQCKTSHIQVAKDGVIKNFFRHTYSKVRYQDSIISRALSIVMKKLLRWDKSVKDVMSDTKTMCMEYESDTNLVAAKKDLIFNSENEKLTLNLKRRYYSKSGSSASRKHCLKVLNNCSGVDPLIIDNISDGNITGPLRVQTSFIMNREAINHFNRVDHNTVYDVIERACYKYLDDGRGKPSTKFYHEIPYRICKASLHISYDKYVKELVTSDYSFDTYKKCRDYGIVKSWSPKSRKWRVAMSLCMQRISNKVSDQFQCEVPLWRLKGFVEKIYAESEDKSDMYDLFGLSNVFFHGSVEGRIGKKRHRSRKFTSCFQEGEFNGKGLVDNYLRKNKMRSPSSVLLDE